MHNKFARDLLPEARITTGHNEDDWRQWLRILFKSYLTDDYGQHIEFAPHHEEFWEWVWALEKGVRPQSFFSIWPRGGGKSSAAEMAAVAIGALKKRDYLVYVSGTQDQADDHVQNVADMLESQAVESRYPELAVRLSGKYGNSKGWRRNRLRTASGFTVDAFGLDRQGRGAKLEEDRPGLMIFDDVDSEADSLATVEKKIRAITRKLIPAGASDLGVLGAQNLVHEDSVFSQVADGRAKFLTNRIVSGPIPAIRDLEYEEKNNRIRVTDGTPTWEGQDLAKCEEMINDMGLEAFLAECQQQVDAPLGNLVYRREKVDQALERGKAVSYDPNASQFISIDPGYSIRASMLSIQEKSNECIEMWAEHSFTHMIDDDIAEFVAIQCLNHHVLVVYYDAEDPGLGRAVEKALDKREATTQVVAVPFNKYKRLSIKATRWLLQHGRIAWQGETTTMHTPTRTQEVPSLFRKEVRGYTLVEGREDETQKGNDHGPDAWSAYASRWIEAWSRSK